MILSHDFPLNVVYEKQEYVYFAIDASCVGWICACLGGKYLVSRGCNNRGLLSQQDPWMSNTVARNIPRYPNGVVICSALKGVGLFCL